MAIENTVSIDFWSTFLDSNGVFDCCLPGVVIIGYVKACLDGMICQSDKSCMILSCMIFLFRRHYNVMCDFFQQ